MLLKRFYCFICLDDGPEQKKYLLFYRTLKNMRTKTASTVLVLCTVVVARVVYYSYYLVDLLLVPTSSSAPSLSSTVVLRNYQQRLLIFQNNQNKCATFGQYFSPCTVNSNTTLLVDF